MNDELQEMKQEMNKNLAQIKLITHEYMKNQNKNNEKKFKIAIIVLASALILSNLGWIIYENQMETVVETTETITINAEQDGEGFNFVSGGDISYGAESKNSKN